MGFGLVIRVVWTENQLSGMLVKAGEVLQLKPSLRFCVVATGKNRVTAQVAPAVFHVGRSRLYSLAQSGLGQTLNRTTSSWLRDVLL